MEKVKLQRRHGQWHYRGLTITRQGGFGTRLNFYYVMLGKRSVFVAEKLRLVRHKLWQMEEDGWAEALQCIDD